MPWNRLPKCQSLVVKILIFNRLVVNTRPFVYLSRPQLPQSYKKIAKIPKTIKRILLMFDSFEAPSYKLSLRYMDI